MECLGSEIDICLCLISGRSLATLRVPLSCTTSQLHTMACETVSSDPPTNVKLCLQDGRTVPRGSDTVQDLGISTGAALSLIYMPQVAGSYFRSNGAEPKDDTCEEHLYMKESGEAIYVKQDTSYYDHPGGGACDIQESCHITVEKFGSWHFDDVGNVLVSFNRSKTLLQRWSCSEGSPWTPIETPGTEDEAVSYELSDDGGLKNWSWQSRTVKYFQSAEERLASCLQATQ